MTIYFAFSDENGSYKKRRSSRFIRAHPWYIRSTLCIDALEWKTLEKEYENLKKSYDLPSGEEIKWSYAYSLYSHKRTGRAIKPKDKYYFLKNYNPEKLISFLDKATSILNNLNYCRAIFTITDNKECQSIDDSRLLKMHLQEAMQRLEMDMQTDNNNLCVLFVDPVSEEKDKSLREAYASLYQNGDIINRYSHIKDSLNIEHSHHSVGIQMADFLAGAFSSLLSERELGKNIYKNTINNIIRKKGDGSVQGYGFREVPGNKPLRNKILTKINIALTEDA